MTWLVVFLLFQTQPAKGSISGTVVDSVSGTPIRKAQVRLGGSGTPVITDASGSFLFDKVPPNYYTLTAMHPEYPQGRTPVNIAVPLAPGERKTGVDVKLTPAAFLSGRIVDEDGDPLPNCSVSLFANMRLTSMVFGGASTNRNGDYKLPPTPPGKYYLEAHCPAPVLQPRPFATPEALIPGPKLGYGGRFYPSARDLSGAQRLTVTPGQVLRGIDFRMTPEPLSSLTVHISGMAAARTTASLTPEDGSPPRQADTVNANMAKSGEVHFHSLPVRRYVLRIHSSTPERMLLAKQPVTVEGGPGEVTVQITPPIPLTGVLRRGETPDPAPTRLTLETVSEQGAHLQADIKPDGTFAFRGVSPGRYRIGSLGNTWIQSVSVGGEVTEGPEFELKPGASGPLEITTGSAAGAVSGDIDLGSAHPSKVAVIATFGFVQIQLSNSTVQPPRYSDKLPPGPYRLYAVEVSESGDIFQLLDHDSLAARGETVDIRANSQTVRNLKLITAEEIEKADQ